VIASGVQSSANTWYSSVKLCGATCGRS
jgi:hypothetical protein